MNELSGDPYAGARRAYQALNSTANDTDWETWLIKHAAQTGDRFDDFSAFASLCRKASTSGILEIGIAEHIAYSAGYFEAMQSLITSLLRSLPISACIPHHQERIRARLVNPDAQFE